MVGILGCELPHETQPSVLVIAVEGLSFENVSCDSEEGVDRSNEGFRVFCQEAVRFSHAYAPSTMSQASMASLMTGLYPFDHRVHHNGSEFLSARFQTLAEVAQSKGYRTLFVSGGAPIWRKSGLAQGFEVFDDAIEVGPGGYYRPSEEVVKLTTNWMEQNEGSPLFTTLFLSDLQFPQIATHTNEGEVREKSAEGQLEEVSESLGTLVRWLKSKKKWNSTHVVLVGLNSLQHKENDPEPEPLSLKSSSVQVTLFIKPARKEKDNVIQWAVDRNVSLVDVGKTMFGWLGLESPASSIRQLEPENLSSALSQSEPGWPENRMVLSETAWPDWLEGSGVRWAVRQNQFLYIYDKRPMIFNTLTDRMEVLPLKVGDPLWNSLKSEVITLLRKARAPQWNGMRPRWLRKIEVARELWRGSAVIKHPRGDESWSRWYLRKVLSAHEWHEVKRLAQEVNDPVGVYVAMKNLGEVVMLPRNPCVRLVLSGKGDKSEFQSECDDELVLALHSWQAAKGDEERAGAQERFVRLNSIRLMDQEIGRLNFLSELRWDVDRDILEGPSTLDYLLTLKELEPFAKKTSALLSNKDLTL